MRPGRMGPEAPAPDLDPAAEIARDRIGELLLRGHGGEFAGPGDRLEQGALLGLSRYHGRTRVSALEHCLRAVEPQSALELLGSGRVASEAPVDKYRPDAGFEQIHTPAVIGEEA